MFKNIGYKKDTGLALLSSDFYSSKWWEKFRIIRCIN